MLLLTIHPVGAQNLLPDPSFASGVSGWTASGASQAMFQWVDLAGSDGVAGFARLQVLGPGTVVASVCVPVVGGKTYSWGASFFPRSASGQVILDFYSNDSCLGLTLVGETSGPSTITLGDWQFEPGPDVMVPASAGSVMYRVMGTAPGNAIGVVDVDNVYFGLQGTRPPGVQGVPALSWPAVFLLAAALATVGLRVMPHA